MIIVNYKVYLIKKNEEYKNVCKIICSNKDIQT